MRSTSHRALRTLHLWAPLAAICLASVFGVQAAARPGGPTDLVRLESIAGRFDAQTSSILIQTSEPVAYVTADPDPLTVLIELHNVTSAGTRNRLTAGDGMVSGVAVEDATTPDGARVARVRVSLARPFAHRVRSARNVIHVELERAGAGAPISAQTAKAATVLRSLRAIHGPSGPIVVLEGNGTLTPTNVQLINEAPYRLVLDFQGVSSSVKPTTPVGNDLVDRVRVARFSATPLVTRVVIDLKRSVPYRLDQSNGALAVVLGAAAEIKPEPAASAPAPAVEPAAAVKPLPPDNAPARPSQDTTELLRRLREVQGQQPPAQQAAAQPPAQPVQPPAQQAQPPAQQVQPPAQQAPVTQQAAVQPPPVAPPPAQPVAAAVTATAGTITPQPPAGPAGLAAAAQQPPAPPATPASVQEQAQPAGRKYTGPPVSLDFSGAPIRDVMRAFGDASGLNIMIDPKVTGTVDVALKDVPWDQAMETILKSAGLGWTLEGNIVRIAPLSVLAEEEKQRRTFAEEQALSGTLDTLTRALNYASAKDVKGTVQNTVLTKRGSIQVDERTNTIIVTDLPGALPAVGQLLDTLDKAQPQVEIEARIVQTTRSFARQLGIKWGFTGAMTPQLGNTTGLAFPNAVQVGGRTGATTSGNSSPAAVNLATTSPATSAIGLSLGAVNGAFNLDVELSALETQGKGRILSTPRVVAVNNYKAKMEQGVQIPIQTVANNTVTVTFKDAALLLEVTPQVTANNTVIMTINLENATPDYTKSVNNIPPINTQIANTQVMTSNNQTIVIGGVFVSREQSQNDHTPGLSRIPLLKWLFRRDSIDDESNELLVFLTPRIVKGG